MDLELSLFTKDLQGQKNVPSKENQLEGPQTTQIPGRSLLFHAKISDVRTFYAESSETYVVFERISVTTTTGIPGWKSGRPGPSPKFAEHGI